ncbi:porin family protein [Massilibacteroides sp.]|uniref:porin family protein n=1 Tax=Massilibacteroides sp. TaxID=2034766 RepID=UPI0026203038|nr:porin family protein [Massilibacteroides sp.]MDD4513946.1 porin family protein [Massilibacteroides sp.]
MSLIRKIFTLVFLLLLVIPAFSQITYGVRGGLSYSALIQKIEHENKAGTKAGFSIGGFADIPFYRRFSFRPELSFVNQGGSFYSRIDNEIATIKNKYNYYSIQMPLNIAYNIPISGVKMAVMMGPTVDYSLFGTHSAEGVRKDLVFGKDEIGELKKWDIGVNMGLVVKYEQVLFSINAVCGTFDRRAVKREGESRLFQNNVTFSFGYIFP